MFTLPNQFAHNVDVQKFILKKLLLASLVWVTTLDIMTVNAIPALWENIDVISLRCYQKDVKPLYCRVLL